MNRCIHNLSIFILFFLIACQDGGQDGETDGSEEVTGEDLREDLVEDADDLDVARDEIFDSADDGPLDIADEEEIELPPGGYEARGLWVTRWNYSSPDDIQTILTQMSDSGFNQIYFQVRGTADAYYASNLEPWAARLSGSLGQDPGWDPLAIAVEEAHRHGIELHAWINSFPMWSGTSPPPDTTPQHIYNAHPEWICVDSAGNPMPLSAGDYVFATPGNPDMQDHLSAVASDIVENYDVDGIHLDYIRYPGPDYSYDAVSQTRYNEALLSEPGLSRADWQRRQVNETVSKIYQSITSIRSEVVLSAAVWGIYQNIWGWSAVSKGYDDYFQDPRAWTADGIIDAICPMIYWSIKPDYGDRTDFAALLDDHVSGNPDRYVYAGIHGDYDSFSEIIDEIEYQRSHGGMGFVIFAYTYLQDHSYWDDLIEGPLALPALVPPMEWK